MEVNQLVKNHYRFFNTQAGGGFYLLLTVAAMPSWEIKSTNFQ